MDKTLLEILICPMCRGDIKHQKAQKELLCLKDKIAFPIRDGIPVMLEEEARLLTEDELLKYSD